MGEYVYSKDWHLLYDFSQIIGMIRNLPNESVPEVCIDDKSYSSPVNPSFGCEIYAGTDCSIWEPMLNSTQIDNMYSSCPVSCSAPCR